MGGSLLGVGEGVREWAVVDILFVYSDRLEGEVADRIRWKGVRWNEEYV